MKKAGNLTLLKKVSNDATGYLPADRFVWEEFREGNAGDEDKPVRVKLRVSITNAELDVFSKIEPSDPIEKVYEALAPYVADWDVLHRDEEGDVYAVGAPAEVGPDAFRYIPRSLVWAIQRAIVNSPFVAVPKAPSTPAGSMGEP